MNIRDFKFFSFESFVAVAEHGSITAAADALGVSKSGVSKAVTEYEKLLGFSLFSRTTRKVEITPAGAQLLPSVRAMLRFCAERHEAVITTARKKKRRHRGSTYADLKAHLREMEQVP